MGETQQAEQARKAVIGIEPNDLVVAQRLAMVTTWRKDYRRFVLLWVISVALFAGVMGKAGVENPLPVIASVAVGAALGIILVPTLIVYLVGPSSAAKTYRIQKSLHGPVDLNWDDTMLQLASEQGTARLKWSDLYRTAENDKMFMLYESNRLYRMIPKRCLSEVQSADVRAIIEKLSV